MGSWAGLRAAEEFHEEQKTETLSSGSEDFEQTLLTSLHNQYGSLLSSQTNKSTSLLHQTESGHLKQATPALALTHILGPFPRLYSLPRRPQFQPLLHAQCLEFAGTRFIPFNNLIFKAITKNDISCPKEIPQCSVGKAASAHPQASGPPGSLVELEKSPTHSPSSSSRFCFVEVFPG